MHLITYAITNKIRYLKLAGPLMQPRIREIIDLLNLALMATRIAISIQNQCEGIEQIRTTEFQEAIGKYMEGSQ